MYRYRFFLSSYLLAISFAIIGSQTFSQQANNIFVAEKLRSYSGKAFQEKLFLHTDREFYIAGEILWFKIYYVDGAFHKPADLSKVAYVEILNEKNEPVLQATVSLLPGEGKGSFYLPTLLNTENYVLRAYTNWMKNFDAGYFFEKKITIVNTLKATEPLSAKDTVTAVSVNFFPEGGNLVNDIQSKVGFAVTGKEGGINNCRGYILDKNGDTVSSFAPLKFGIGNFKFKPVTGNQYNAVIVLPEGAVITRTIPGAFDNGYTMQVSENDKEQIVINIQRKNMQDAGSTNKQLLLAVHTRQVLKMAEKISVNNSYALTIDKKQIDAGVTVFTLFNENDKPVCERLFYKKYNAAITLNISSDKKHYETRQKVNLSLSTQNNNRNNLPLNLSASVFKIDSLQKADEATISSYMWLSSDLAGNVESPEYYFSSDDDVNAATDNLMLTHGWRRFRWDDEAMDSDNFIKYLPEVNGQLVTGKVTDIRNEKPAEKVPAYLSITGRPYGFYTSESDKNGLVNFEIKDYYGIRQLIARPGIVTDSFYKVDILTPYSESVSGKKYPHYQLKEDTKELLKQKSINMQVQNIYAGDSIRNFYEPVPVDSLPFYGLGEAIYKLDDYKRFTTMEEVLREYVMSINIAVKKGGLVLKVFNPVARDFYNGDALVLLDGVAITDPNKIITYDPLKVKQLDVITNRYVLGKFVFNGIASFSTYEGVFNANELDPKLIAIDYNGLQLQREFYSPVYETKAQLEKRIPDFRNTLLWSPDIVTNKEGKAAIQFYTADRPGKYIVIVQGMSNNGDFVSEHTTFEVK